jgi:2-polyprenyl-3-methyl-5-hydroxy-6-metoxy-1,4-benzoquinol methylase
MTPYVRSPTRYQSGIPVFSEMDPFVANYERIASDHVDAMRDERDNPWIPNHMWHEMENATVDLTRIYVPSAEYGSVVGEAPTIRILDIGVGLGRLATKLKAVLPSSCEYYGVDIALPYLEVAREKGIQVALARIEDMPYHRDYFHLITCTDVLEHVPDLNLCISKILAVLKPGGHLIVRVPNREDLSPYLRDDYPYEMAHLRAFDVASLELLFTKVFRCRFVDHSPGLVTDSASLLRYNLPVKGYRSLIRLLLGSVKAMSPVMYKRALHAMYHPAEINVVIQKPAS